jgi:hypothetical protein
LKIYPIVKFFSPARSISRASVSRTRQQEAKPEKKIDDTKTSEDKVDDPKEEDASKTTTENSDTTAASTTTSIGNNHSKYGFTLTARATPSILSAAKSFTRPIARKDIFYTC